MGAFWLTRLSAPTALNSKLSTEKGMYGFDSKMNCHVSMSSLAVTLVIILTAKK